MLRTRKRCRGKLQKTRSKHSISLHVSLNRYSFDGCVNLDSLAASMLATGFQATNVGLAINEINRMVSTMFAKCMNGTDGR
jgi:hypothetical protein